MVTYDALMTYAESVPPFGVFREKNKKNGDRTFNCDQLSGEIMIILSLNVRQETEDCFFKVSLPEVPWHRFKTSQTVGRHCTHVRHTNSQSKK